MHRALRVAAASTLALLAAPSMALAEEAPSATGVGIHIGLSVLGLFIAVALLVSALGVRRIAAGGMVAQRIELVVLAAVCLAGSALAQWGTFFVVDLTLDQVQLASEVLVIVAMALLAAYFWNVRVQMKGFLDYANAAAAYEAAASQDAASGAAEVEAITQVGGPIELGADSSQEPAEDR